MCGITCGFLMGIVSLMRPRIWYFLTLKTQFFKNNKVGVPIFYHHSHDYGHENYTFNCSWALHWSCKFSTYLIILYVLRSNIHMWATNSGYLGLGESELLPYQGVQPGISDKGECCQQVPQVKIILKLPIFNKFSTKFCHF